MSTAIRVLLWGDVSGCFSTFEESVERAADKYGAFDACICLGDFFGPIKYTKTDRDIRARLREILPRSLAVSTCWILDQPSSPHTFGAELREAFPDGLEDATNCFRLLPSTGFKIVEGLRLALYTLPPNDPSDLNAYPMPAPPPEWDVIDLCLTTAWPEGMHVGLVKDDLRHLQKILVNCGGEHPTRSRAVYGFVNSLGPIRYMISVGGPQVFYQRPGFKRSDKTEVITRFVALSSMSASLPTFPFAERKFIHSLRLVPWTQNPPAMQAPPVLADSPFPPMSLITSPVAKKARTLSTSVQETGQSEIGSKCSSGDNSTEVPWRQQGTVPTVIVPPTMNRNSSDGGNRSESGRLTDRSTTIYVSNIPYNASREDLQNAIQPIAAIQRIRFPRTSDGRAGRAWITFNSVEDANRVLQSEPEVELHGRILRFNWAKLATSERLSVSRLSESPTSAQDIDTTPSTHPPPPSSTAVVIDTRPHTDCWFCLYNPHCEKSLIVNVGEQVYTAVARGALVREHLLILPVGHQPNLGLCPTSTVEETCRTMRNLTDFWAAKNMVAVFFERYIPMKSTRAMHTQIQAIPIPVHKLDEVLRALRTQMVNSMLRWMDMETPESLSSLLSSILKFADETRASDLCQSQEEKTSPQALFKTLSYWWISVIGPDVMRTFVGVAQSPQMMNLNLAREILANAMGSPERAVWKKCVLRPAEEALSATLIRTEYDRHCSMPPPPNNPPALQQPSASNAPLTAR